MAPGSLPLTEGSPSPSARRRLCAALLAADPSIISDIELDDSEFARELRYQGLGPLLHHQLVNRQHPRGAEKLPAPWRALAHRAAAAELLHARAVRELLAALAESGVRTLLLKGTALAYQIYPSPELRCRGDTDLLIALPDRLAATKVFRALGYDALPSVGGELISSQRTYCRTDEYGQPHHFDLHWRISNFQLLAERFSFDELWPRSVFVPVLGAGARALNLVDALLLACMHRLGHRQAPYYVNGVPHYDGDRVIWIYDIHLISQVLTAAQWRELAALAARKGLDQVCRDGLRAAMRDFASKVPPDIIDALDRAACHQRLPSAWFSAPRWRWELRQWASVKGVASRWQLLREHLLPPPQYMRAKYRGGHGSLLPFYYLHRLIAGIAKRW